MVGNFLPINFLTVVVGTRQRTRRLGVMLLKNFSKTLTEKIYMRREY